MAHIPDKPFRISVFRRAHFNAAHRLHNPQWDEARNQAVFGLCNSPHFHGHNYEIEVRVTGPVDPDTGMVVDMKWLKELIRNEVESRFDHKNLNLDTEEFRARIPTAENICYVIWHLLRPHIDSELELHVRLYETPRNYVEYPAP